MSRERSPYLVQVDQACTALESGEVPADWRAFFADRRSAADRANANRTKSSGAARNRSGGALTSLDDEGQRLYDELKQWRAGVARAASVPAYVVFHDATLEAIASGRPTSARELLALPGLGPVKVNRYGEGVLAVVAGNGSGY